MPQQNKIQLFEERKVRTLWDDEKEKWFFSIVDVVAVLTDSPNPRKYWSVLKTRLKKEGSELTTNCSQLKMRSADGKNYLTDVADTKQLFRLIQSIPSPKAEPFKLWMAQVASERLDQMQDPELSIEQAMTDYRRLGYSENWINQRIKSIEIRKELTDEWKRCGVEEGVQFATLTDIIYKTWSDHTAKEYKQLKNLKKENLRDNMTNRELVLNMLAELTTKGISENSDPQTMQQHEEVAVKGATVARNARIEMEEAIGEKVVTSLNAKSIHKSIGDAEKKIYQDVTKPIRSREYKFDDPFKAKARNHQFQFRDNELNDSNDEANPQVLLSARGAEQGLIFYEGYREYLRKSMGGFYNTQLFSNMLRSEHIPYNIFSPMWLDKPKAIKLFSSIIGINIDRIMDIKIEFAGKMGKDKYLCDGTSFDTYVEYIDQDGKIGGIGVEVKYTEKGYPLSDNERKNISNPLHKYTLVTSNSGYFNQGFEISRFLKDNDLRQIWRNHILGYSMVENQDFEYFHHIHLYPAGNTHFSDHALPAYKSLLTEIGVKSFIDLTYEVLFERMREVFVTKEQAHWLDYLERRYIKFSCEPTVNSVFP